MVSRSVIDTITAVVVCVYALASEPVLHACHQLTSAVFFRTLCMRSAT
jgi:hypothetical protein